MKVFGVVDGSRHSHGALDWLPNGCRPHDCSSLLVHAVEKRSTQSDDV